MILADLNGRVRQRGGLAPNDSQRCLSRYVGFLKDGQVGFSNYAPPSWMAAAEAGPKITEPVQEETTRDVEEAEEPPLHRGDPPAHEPSSEPTVAPNKLLGPRPGDVAVDLDESPERSTAKRPKTSPDKKHYYGYDRATFDGDHGRNTCCGGS